MNFLIKEKYNKTVVKIIATVFLFKEVFKITLIIKLY